MGTGLADAAQDEGKRDCRSAILNIFKNFDARGDGLYSRAELTSLLQALDTRERMSGPGIGSMIEALDADRKGWIHYEVFCDFIFSTASPEVFARSLSLQEQRPRTSFNSLAESFSRSLPDALRLSGSWPALTEAPTEPLTLPPSNMHSQEFSGSLFGTREGFNDEFERTGRSTTSSALFDESLPLPGSELGSRPHSPGTQANLRAVLEIAAEGFIPGTEGPKTRKAESEERAIESFFNSIDTSQNGELSPEEFAHALSVGLMEADRNSSLCSTEVTLLAAARTDTLDKSVRLRIWELAAPWSSQDGLSSRSTVALVSCAQDDNSAYRSYMEDGQKVLDPFPLQSPSHGDSWGYYAVFDGHGGRDVVDYVEMRLHEIVLAELDNLTASQNGQKCDVSAVLQDSFRKVDAQLAMIGAWRCGCTATVALVHRHGTALSLYVANVGDSRAVALGESGPTRLTRDHKASDPDEAARIIEEGGLIRHGRVGGSLCVSRSLGDHALKNCGVSCVPDIQSLESDTSSGSRALVIASDGLWDALEDADAENIVADCIQRAVDQNRDQQAVAAYLQDVVASELVEEAKAKGSRDNILAMVVFL